MVRKLFLTVFYTGLSSVAPGTVGSFLSLILGLVLLTIVSPSNLFMISILITVIAVKQINAYEKEVGEHDSKEIVIDELVGMWLTLSICNVTPENVAYVAPLAFLYFRLFDIWKPSIIGKIDEKIEGGWGVMGDDIIAGIAAGVATSGTYQLLLKFVL